MAYGDEPSKPAPTCDGCGAELKCLGCDDTRPTADEIYKDWQIRSPLDRWETVTKVEYGGEHGPVLVWTDKTGPDYSWRYYRSTKVEAIRPAGHLNGIPEIRIIEYSWGDGPIHAVPTLSTIHRTDMMRVLVEARYVGKGKGWNVVHRPNGRGEPVTIHCESKAKARTAVRAAAKLHAKALGVKVTTEATR